MHRTGHHIREAIVEEARATLEHHPRVAASNGQPEPLPPSQEEYTAQANAAILDLFPRIPHTDRQTIIVHAFNLVRPSCLRVPCYAMLLLLLLLLTRAPVIYKPTSKTCRPMH